MSRMLLALSLLAGVFAAAAIACGGESEPEATPAETPAASITVTSTAFSDGGRIPVAHTCDGEDTAPPLAWTGAPAGTVTFAVAVSDPDAPARPFIHGIVFDIPAGVTSLAEAAFVPPGATGGRNGFRTIGYGGPCPPEGDGPHGYEFRVYALDTALDLAEEALLRAVEEAMAGHILATGMLTGVYER